MTLRRTIKGADQEMAVWLSEYMYFLNYLVHDRLNNAYLKFAYILLSSLSVYNSKIQIARSKEATITCCGLIIQAHWMHRQFRVSRRCHH